MQIVLYLFWTDVDRHQIDPNSIVLLMTGTWCRNALLSYCHFAIFMQNNFIQCIFRLHCAHICCLRLPSINNKCKRRTTRSLFYSRQFYFTQFACSQPKRHTNAHPRRVGARREHKTDNNIDVRVKCVLLHFHSHWFTITTTTTTIRMTSDTQHNVFVHLKFIILLHTARERERN